MYNYDIDPEVIIDNVDIVDYISQFVDLSEKNGEYWGLSCFKDEKTPSFSVRANPPQFYDFSSGIGGNVITFAMRYYDCSYREAIQKLSDFANISPEHPGLTARLNASRICQTFAPKKTHSKADKSQILSDNYMDKYEKNDKKLDVWRAEGISDESLERFNVKYDWFSNRIVYPIRNLDGKIVNIGGRTLDPEYKEKGLRKYTYFFPWGQMKIIYGAYDNIDFIKQSDEIILFEGCKSVLIADSWGIKNCGAILTSHMNPAQLDILINLGIKNVTFCLDNDIPVRKDKNIQKLKHYLNVYYVWDYEGLLDEKDSPVDKGREIFQRLYDNKLRLR